MKILLLLLLWPLLMVVKLLPSDQLFYRIRY
jgi:hypothetical protein